MFTHKNPNILVFNEPPIRHAKASETYIHVKLTYPIHNKEMDLWIPTEYRRLGVSIKDTSELEAYLDFVYEQLNPSLLPGWINLQEIFWKTKPNADVTKSFFDKLSPGEWKCVGCELPPNPNWARRIQDIKEYGYTIATNTNRFCPVCKEKKTHLMLLPLQRGGAGNGYETWTPKLRKKIINVLNSFDIYENTKSPHCLPDHKFPEIRWDSQTKEENPDSMTDQQIINKFQLMSNQRNLQKREICRICFQSGKRGIIFGIPFFYQGSDTWDPTIPIRGKEAEKGCVGCPWYDIGLWRKKLLEQIKN